jgi:hypothetical protein
LLGDDRGHQSHQELNALVPRLNEELGVVGTWVPSDSDFDISEYDGVWLVPGSPYANDDAVLEALTVVRRKGTPFIGSPVLHRQHVPAAHWCLAGGADPSPYPGIRDRCPR